MTTGFHGKNHASAQRAAIACGIYSLIGGAVTLIGWFTNSPRLTDWVGSDIAMFANTAVAAACAGAALLLPLWKTPWATKLAARLGVVVALLGGATLFQHLTEINLGIDTLLVRPAWGVKAAVAPGRMGLPASTCFILIGIALLLSNGGRRVRRAVPVLGILVTSISLLSVIGYVFGAKPLFTLAEWTGIAFQTATILLALGLGIVASVPELEPMRTISENSAAGVLARRSLPFIVGLPILLGWVRVLGQHGGWFDTAMGTALLVLVLVGLFSFLLWWWVGAVAVRETALRESEARLSGLVNSAMDAVITVDETQRVVLFNPAAERMFGCSSAEALGSSLDRFIPARFRRAHRGHIEKFGQTGITTRRMGALGALSGVRANGEEFPIEASISHMETGGQKLFTVILRDITERKRSEDDLRQAQQRLELALQSSGAVTWGWNVVENRLDDWTAEYRQLYGFSPDEPQTFEAWRAKIHPDDRARLSRRMEQICNNPGDDAWNEEFRIHHPERGERWIGGSGRAYRDGAGKVVRMAGVNLDVTERRKVEEALRQAHEKVASHAGDLEKLVNERTAKLRETVNELEAFSYSIAHDMRAPLRAMNGFANILRSEHARDLDATAQGYLQRIQHSASRLDALIVDILNYSKLVRGEMELRPVTLENLIQEIIASYPALHADGVNIAVETPMPRVLANEGALTQVVSNLLDNAAKFVAPGIQPRVRVWAERCDDGQARVWFEDNGIGIGKESQARLFNIFTRLNRPELYEGTGIGLAVVRKAVERMGGTVGLESEKGQGSRFWVKLKLAEAA